MDTSLSTQGSIWNRPPLVWRCTKALKTSSSPETSHTSSQLTRWPKSCTNGLKTHWSQMKGSSRPWPGSQFPPNPHLNLERSWLKQRLEKLSLFVRTTTSTSTWRTGFAPEGLCGTTTTFAKARWRETFATSTFTTSTGSWTALSLNRRKRVTLSTAVARTASLSINSIWRLILHLWSVWLNMLALGMLSSTKYTVFEWLTVVPWDCLSYINIWWYCYPVQKKGH